MSDLRSLPDFVLKAYLFSLGGWGVALVVLWSVGAVGIALSLCFPLAVWLGVLTMWWWLRTLARVRRGELLDLELAAGVYSVGRILAGGGLIPGIVFVSYDPLSVPNWGTFGGVFAVSAVAAVLLSMGRRVEKRWLQPGLLVIAWLTLPINATGAVSAGAILGVFDAVIPGDQHIPGIDQHVPGLD